jgi:hypothetical protein
MMGTLIASVAAPTSALAAQSASSDRSLERVADAINELRIELHDERQFADIAPIRAAQKQFLRSNGKLPDFIEVGADVWFQIYDWHVRWQLPAQESRDPQGRLTLAMNQTLIILRPDTQGNFVGLPYDAR